MNNSDIAEFQTESRDADLTYTYDDYWCLVVGEERTAADAVYEFELDPTDRGSIDGWLGLCEVESWANGEQGGPIPASWVEYHQRALDELCGVEVVA